MKNATPPNEMIAGRKVSNHHRPASMPRTAVQIDGVWYRNQHAAAKARKA